MRMFRTMCGKTLRYKIANSLSRKLTNVKIVINISKGTVSNNWVSLAYKCGEFEKKDARKDNYGKCEKRKNIKNWKDKVKDNMKR